MDRLIDTPDPSPRLVRVAKSVSKFPEHIVPILTSTVNLPNPVPCPLNPTPYAPHPTPYTPHHAP